MVGMSRKEPPRPMGCMLAVYPPPVPAVKRPCGRCPHETLVWVSMPMLAEVKAGTVEPMCLQCLDTVFRSDPEAELALTQPALDMVTALGLREWADQFTTAVNQRKRRVTGEWVAPASGWYQFTWGWKHGE